MNNKLVIIIISFLIFGSVAYLTYSLTNEPTQPTTGTKNKVVASFYPLAEFATQIGGNQANIVNLTPVGVEPHNFEPTAKQIAEMYESDFVLINGAGLEEWFTKVAPNLSQRKIPIYDMADQINLINNPSDSSEVDPHFWLDPILAQKQVEIITQAFIKADPANESMYEANSLSYLQKLDDLDLEYQTGLANCSLREVVSSHEVFGYLSKRYNFDATSVSGLTPESEPSARQLAQIADQVKAKNIKYILFESLASPKLANTLASEANISTLEFNPLEGLTAEQQAEGESYISIMKSNLQNLKIAMQCE